ncbi:MAG: serine hydrolase [Pseudomonadota bacterium]
MKALLIAASGAALIVSSAANAQTAQEQLDTRYDRALAAGYKALFLCSAIANAEANGAIRMPESVHAWELTGVQAPFDAIIRDLPYEIVRRPSGHIAHVQVGWDDTMPDRLAAFFPGSGCTSLPIGVVEDWSDPSQPYGEYDESEGPRDRPIPPPPVVTIRRPIEPGMFNMAGRAFTGEYGEGTRTTAVLVTQDGATRAERYTEGFDANTPQRTWSVAKSIAATLVGAAVQRGEYSVDDGVGMAYWRSGRESDPRNAITIDHMLRMASGRYSDTPGNRTDPLYWGGATVGEHATNWPMISPPGAVFRYANNDTLMAIKAIDRYLSYYHPSDFFEKLGMQNTVAETDMRGDYILSSQVWSTARDLATLGQLYLNDGVWNEERLLPENWREYVSDPAGPQPEGSDWGYGAGWWTFKRPEGNAFDGIPGDAFAARGNRGQYIVVVPSRNVVIVRRGEDMVGTRFDIAAFTRDVLATLAE